MIGPTLRQQELLRFIADFTRRERMPPTLVDMASFLGAKSKTAAFDHLRALEKKGYLLRRPRAARATLLTAKAQAFLQSLAEGSEPQ